ncbi:MAG TPA: right-handed parallel beta-helix repeat-containing protein [Armatimonadota bacterium]|jgi:parallel beta-helix repeat protein
MHRSHPFVYLLTLICVLSAALCAPRAGAAIIYVNQAAGGAVHDGSSWSAAALTMQAGIDAARWGDEVWVAKGTYVESVTVSKPIALFGGFAGTETAGAQRNAAANVTTLDANQANCAMYLSTGGCTVDGFTVRNAKDSGIIAGGAATISNNVITGIGSYYGGVYLYQGISAVSHNVVTGNAGPGICVAKTATGTISDNMISGNATGIAVQSSGLTTIARNSLTGNGGGISVDYGGSAAISANTIANNSGTAVTLDGNSTASVSDSIITANTGGVHVQNGSVTVTNCTITANKGYYSSLFWVTAVSVNYGRATVNNCLVANNHRGLWTATSGTLTVRNSDVWGNAWDNYAGIADPTGTNGNISVDPKLSSFYREPHLQPGSPCIDAGDNAYAVGATDAYGKARIAGARVDIGADESAGATWPSLARVWHVSPSGSDDASGASWQTARKTIGAAFASAQADDEVWAAAGTLDAEITVPTGVALYGGFAGTETAREQRDWRANVCELGSVKCPNYGAAVDGFAIRGGVRVEGQAAIANNRITGGVTYPDGAGVVVTGAATVANNVISGVYSDSGASPGGGVYVGGAATLTGNQITGNRGALGGGVAIQGRAALTGNTITGNASPDLGGGVYVSGIDYSGQSASAILARNVISGNVAASGAGLYVNAGATANVADCLIAANYARTEGSGLYVNQGIATVSNCTLTGNAARGAGSAVYASAAGMLTLSNSLAAFNTAGLSGAVGALVAMRSNDVYGNGSANYTGIADPTGTNGNISQDPKLSGIYRDVHIQPGSPCVDAGADSVVTPGETDLYGETRVIGAHVDIGADESDGTTWTATARAWRVSPAGDDAADGASWATAKKTIGAALAAARYSDEVWVAKGTYAEPVTLPALVALYGGFMGDETDRGQRDWARNAAVLTGAVKSQFLGAEIDGFVVRGGGIMVQSGSALLANNLVSGVAATGVAVWPNGDATIINNIIAAGGVGIAPQGSARIINNTISGNRFGVSAYQSAPVQLTNNLLAFNDGGVNLPGDPAPTFSHNNVYGSVLPNYSGAADPTGQNGNISMDPALSNPYHDVHIQPASPCVDAGDDAAIAGYARDVYAKSRLVGAHVDIGAEESDGTAWTVPARVWRVSPEGDDAGDGASWQTAKRTLAAAVAAAQGGDEVWAAKGAYAEGIAPSAGVALYGGFAGVETARGQRDWAANPSSISNDAVAVTCQFAAATVDGFHIQSTGASGLTAMGSVRLAHDVASGCKVNGLVVGGGIAAITDCVIADNGDTGVSVESGDLAVSGCLIRGNKYGVSTGTSGAATLTRNSIVGNWIGVECNGASVLRDNLLAGGSYGVKIFGDSTLVNNTIAGNALNGVWSASSASLTNNVIAFNGEGVRYAGGRPPALFTNDVFGNTTANYISMTDQTGKTGNISADPRFVNRAGGAYRLMAGSPCIDAGADAAITPDETDLDGHPRRAGAHVDMGAYEAGSGRFTLADAARALAMAGGLSAATPEDLAHLGLAPGGPVSAPEAVTILRKAAGLDVNP